MGGVFLIVLVSVAILISSGSAATYWGDVQVLRDFKNGLDPNSLRPGSCLSSWDFTVDPCDSLFGEKFTCGFRCDVVAPDGTSRVTDLSLDQAGYSGPLTSTSWDLPYLQTMDLSGNYFTGRIPESFSNLTRIQQLSLSRNSLSHSVPHSFFSLSYLEELCLDGNQLQGRLPSSLNNLKNLKRLDVQDNKFTGELADLSQLINLNYFDASDNAISGELPSAYPPSLFQITLRNNQIKGNIPASMISLPYLAVIDLSHNNLTGSVPAGLFTHPSLQQLTLSYNQFGSVEAPGNWGLQSELVAIDLGNNQIRGFLPAFMGVMPKLSALVLENNKFTGMIPTQFGLKAVAPREGVSQFERLLLGGNYLFGPIPSPLMRLKPGEVLVRLGNNCLYWCPVSFFFCDGGRQKSLAVCKAFSP